jgi:3'(2'), 5'-bisphosphate nucleotidase
MPTGVGYREKIWVCAFCFRLVYSLTGFKSKDHAPGAILVEEAGGIVTDSRGLPLNFGLGRTLGENFGVVAAGKEVHAAVLDAVQQATGGKAKA